MDFSLSAEHQAIDEAVRRLMARFPESYWLERDAEGGFPDEFHRAVAAAGWLGIAMPESVGGAGLGVLEACVLMHAVANSPGAMAAASSIHLNIFGPHAITRFGSDEQRRRFLPDLIAGRTRACFAVTEPDAGLDTSRITTRAEPHGDGYVVTGRKIWTSTAQVADRMLLLARTGAAADGLDGLTLFYAPLDRRYVTVREIAKMGRKAVDSNELFIDALPVPREDRIGDEGAGFRCILHSFNPERLLVAAEAVGIGRYAIARAARYANERVVFGRPIGKNQAVQHPLAQSWMELEAAWLAVLRGATLADRGEPCGIEANTAKYLASEAALRATDRAVQAHGGMGYAREFHVERLLREAWITRLAPVSPEMILNYIAEKALGLPRSY
jgi:acyl-CoA dehydrogenase